MNKKDRANLEKSLVSYFKEIHKIYTNGHFREESFYPSFKRLIEDGSKVCQIQLGVNVLVAPRKTEAGIPDFRIGKNGEIIGYKTEIGFPKTPRIKSKKLSMMNRAGVCP